MRLMRNAERAELWFGGRKVMEHTPQHPFIFAVEGSFAYRSSHGNFKIAEKLKRRIPFALTGGGDDSLVFTAEGARRVEVRFSEAFEGVEARFTPNGEFITELHVAAVKGEGIFGGGEQYRQLDMKGERIVNFVSEE